MKSSKILLIISSILIPVNLYILFVYFLIYALSGDSENVTIERKAGIIFLFVLLTVILGIILTIMSWSKFNKDFLKTNKLPIITFIISIALPLCFFVGTAVEENSMQHIPVEQDTASSSLGFDNPFYNDGTGYFGNASLYGKNIGEFSLKESFLKNNTEVSGYFLSGDPAENYFTSLSVFATSSDAANSLMSFIKSDGYVVSPYDKNAFDITNQNSRAVVWRHDNVIVSLSVKLGAKSEADFYQQAFNIYGKMLPPQAN